MTDDQWKYLYKVAGIVFRQGVFQHGFTKSDFQQTCAVEALKHPDSYGKALNKRSWISSLVNYVAKDWRAATFNIASRRSEWVRLRHEQSLDLDTLEDDYLLDFSSVSEIESKLNQRDLYRKLKKLLKPLEIVIIDHILQGMNYSEIAAELNKTRDAISKRVQVINKKLEGF